MSPPKFYEDNTISRGENIAENPEKNDTTFRWFFDIYNFDFLFLLFFVFLSVLEGILSYICESYKQRLMLYYPIVHNLTDEIQADEKELCQHTSFRRLLTVTNAIANIERSIQEFRVKINWLYISIVYNYRTQLKAHKIASFGRKKVVVSSFEQGKDQNSEKNRKICFFLL